MSDAASQPQATQPSDAQISQQSREFLHDIWIDDLTQKMAVGRAVFAAGYGIDPRPYARPFPGTQSHVTMASSTPKSSGLKGALPAILGALGGAIGTGVIGVALSSLLGGGSPNNVEATIEPAEYRVIFSGEDGLKVEQETQSQNSGGSE